MYRDIFSKISLRFPFKFHKKTIILPNRSFDIFYDLHITVVFNYSCIELQLALPRRIKRRKIQNVFKFYAKFVQKLM